MEVYLDNAATTRAFDSVKEIIVKTLEVDYGNPSSMHKKGLDAEKYIKGAKDILAKALKADVKEIYFTSGGTESNNMALIGAAYGNRRSGNHIITTKIEHPSVHNPLIFLEENGFRISYISVDSLGRIHEEELLEAVCEDTILVSLMYVNNETGSVQNIKEISKKIKQKNPVTLVHVDAIQAFGKYIIYPSREGIDLLSISGHKIHGPKGSGVLYVKDKVKVKPILFGGGQQKGMRSGTENVPGVAGIGQAVSDIYKDHEKMVTKLYDLKQQLIDGLKRMEGVYINCAGDAIRESAPHIVSASFEGIRSEVLLHALEDKGIYVSSGSACATNHPELSTTLQAIGLDKKLLDSTLRFSFSVYTTREDISYTLETLEELVPILRKYSRH
ncbi:MAG: cysteine desulfurase family protein [Anaerocolumna sp.]